MKLPEHNIEFQIQTIELLDLNLVSPQVPLLNQVTFEYNLSIEHKINPENNLIVVLVSIQVNNQENASNFASIRTSCIFHILNFNDFYSISTKQFLLPESIAVTLNSIAISTTRGIMFSQFKGTFLHNAVLPVIDPKSFVTNK